jgi:hypothetical protein
MAAWGAADEEFKPEVEVEPEVTGTEGAEEDSLGCTKPDVWDVAPAATTGSMGAWFSGTLILLIVSILG